MEDQVASYKIGEDQSDKDDQVAELELRVYKDKRSKPRLEFENFVTTQTIIKILTSSLRKSVIS